MIIAGLLLVAGPGEARAESLRLALVLGNNTGHHARRSLRYAERDARKFHDVLVHLGGFETRNVSLLLGQTAPRAWQTLRAMERRIKKAVRKPGTRTMLVIYYSGHADGSVLELGKTSLDYARLTAFLKSSGAHVRLAFVDSCRSGKLVAAKGGRRSRGYRIQVADQVKSSGYAIITSSAADELSQESAEIRGSFFTHYLVSAMRGAGDQSGDGRVTLGEAYNYVYAHTVARTSATVGGSQHPMYEFKLAGRGDIVLAGTASKQATLTVAAGRTGRVLVLNKGASSMVAEAPVRAEAPTKLALAGGSYLVYLVSGRATYRARVALASGRHRRLGRGDFVAQRLDRAVAKGGLFQRRRGHRLLTGMLVRNMPLEGGTAAFGSALEYRLEITPSWYAAARLTWSAAADTAVSTGYFDLGGHLGLGYLWRLSWVSLRAGAQAGYEHMFQDDRDGLRRDTSAFSYGGVVGVEVPLGRLLIHAGVTAGARLFNIRDSGMTHRFDVQGLAGVGWRWGD